MSDQEIEKFYQEVLEPCYYLNVIEELKKKKAEGYTIYICSASVEAYLRFYNFFQSFDLYIYHL